MKRYLISAVVIQTLAFGGTAFAGLSAPVTWSPMTMLNITLSGDQATGGKLSVVDQAKVINLAYDTYSNPTVTSGTTAYGRSNYTTTTPGAWDSSQPWGVLNSTAFSRQLGWNPGSGTSAANIQAAYGTGASIWIEELSSSAGLETYLAVGKYGVNSNNSTTVDTAANGYSGIFGTAGSSQKWQWDYKMDHNTYTVPLSAITQAGQTFSATYKVYIGDASGNEILNTDGSSTASTETWTWTATATPTPIPATAWLFSSGLLGFIGIRRRNTCS